MHDINDDWSDVFEQNTPACVAQQVKTRLLLWLGEFFLDTSDGTPYLQDIIGVNTNYDLQIQARILGTEGVLEITNYSSSIEDRFLSVNCTLSTIYGSTELRISTGA
jgi:hypothetical protein